MASLTTHQTTELIVTWIAQSYPGQRIPTGLIKRVLGESPSVDPRVVDAAVRFAIDRGLLTSHGRSAEGEVVSVTALGIEQGQAHLGRLQQSSVGVPTPAAAAAIDQVVGEFRGMLLTLAASWAKEAGSEMAPLHVFLAAKSMASGDLAKRLDELDQKRDKSNDGPAMDRLLATLWRTP